MRPGPACPPPSKGLHTHSPARRPPTPASVVLPEPRGPHHDSDAIPPPPASAVLPRGPHHDSDAILLQRGLVIGHFAHSHNGGGPVLLQVLAGKRTKAGWAGAEGAGCAPPRPGPPGQGHAPQRNRKADAQQNHQWWAFAPDDSLWGEGDFLLLPGRLSAPALTAKWPARHKPSFQHIPTLILGARDPPWRQHLPDKAGAGQSWPGSHGRVPPRAQLDPTRGPAKSPGADLSRRGALRGHRAGTCSVTGRSQALHTRGEAPGYQRKGQVHSQAVYIYPLRAGWGLSTPQEPMLGLLPPHLLQQLF